MLVDKRLNFVSVEMRVEIGREESGLVVNEAGAGTELVCRGRLFGAVVEAAHADFALGTLSSC